LTSKSKYTLQLPESFATSLLSIKHEWYSTFTSMRLYHCVYLLFYRIPRMSKKIRYTLCTYYLTVHVQDSALEIKEKINTNVGLRNIMPHRAFFLFICDWSFYPRFDLSGSSCDGCRWKSSGDKRNVSRPWFHALFHLSRNESARLLWKHELHPESC